MQLISHTLWDVLFILWPNWFGSDIFSGHSYFAHNLVELKHWKHWKIVNTMLIIPPKFWISSQVMVLHHQVVRVVLESSLKQCNQEVRERFRWLAFLGSAYLILLCIDHLMGIYSTNENSRTVVCHILRIWPIAIAARYKICFFFVLSLLAWAL